MIEIVSATRMSENDFWSKSALGISLRRLAYDSRIFAHIALENKRGLPEIYNERINASDAQPILVFIHDDVWIDDFFFVDRILQGLASYDVIGVAGNRRRIPNQPAWAFINNEFTWDDKVNLSGSVAHGKEPFGTIGHYGSVPAQCELLDGVFLAANKSALNSTNVQFDPKFDFHFYDMDFCRSARKNDLSLGTWPICLTHQSGGVFGSAKWKEMLQLYLEKWQS